jgi:hypothetical protein
VEATPQPPAPSGEDLTARALGLLDRAQTGDLAGALDAWGGVQHLEADPAGKRLWLETLVGFAEAPETRRVSPAATELLRILAENLPQFETDTLKVDALMALAELETSQRDPRWAAHWVREALGVDPGDVRPWDLLDLLLDAVPGLPIDPQTREQLRALRKAQKGAETHDMEHPEEVWLVVDVETPP